MRKSLLLSCLVLLNIWYAQAQVGIGTTTPNAHAVLDLRSPSGNQGLLIPSLSTSQRTASALISSLAASESGLLVYDNNDNLFYYWQGSQWVAVQSAGGVAGGDLTGNYPNPTIGAGAITTLKIADGAITPGKMAPSSNDGQVLTTSGGVVTWASIPGSGTVTSVATGTGLTGGPITGSGTISLANTGVTAATYGSASQVPQLTIDAQGRITAAGNVTILSTPNFTGNLLGDVTGTQGATVVSKLQGSALSATAPTANQVLKWNGTAWAPGTDVGTTYTAGSGINITGTTLAASGITATNMTAGNYSTVITSGTYPVSITGNAATATTATSSTNFTGSLAGDVTGTQGATVVSKLQGSAVSATAPTSNQVLKWSGTAWAPGTDNNTAYTAGSGINLAGTTLSASGITATNMTAGNYSSVITSGTYPVSITGNAATATAATSATSFTGSLAGDVTGTQGATVITALPDSKLATISTAGKVSGGAITSGTIGGTTIINTSGNITGGVFTGNGSGLTNITAVSAANFTGSLAGDVTGTQGATVVGKLQGSAVSATAPTTNQVLKWNGTAWAPAADANAGGTITSITAGTGLSGGTITSTGTINLANTTVTPAAYGDATHVGQFTVDAQGRITSAASVIITGAAPTGSAGGDLTGNYPSPTIATGAVTASKMTAGNYSSVITSGTYPVSITGNAATATTATSATSFTGSLAGDVTGTQGATVITALPDSKLATISTAGKVSGGAITSGTIGGTTIINTSGNITGGTFTGNGSGLTNVTAASATNFTGSLAGDVTGTQGATVVGKLQGSAVSATAPTTNQILKWNGTAWAPAADANSGGTVTSIATSARLTGGPISTTGTLDLATSGVTAAAYGSGTQVPVITVDTYGRITNATTATISSATNFTGSLAGDVTGTQGATVITALPDSKLATISTAGKVSGSAITSGTIGGTTIINTTGNITGGTFTGNGSGLTNVTATNFTGSLAGDVTGTQGATVITALPDSKLATISTAGKVSGSAITSGTIGGTTAINTTGSISFTGAFLPNALPGTSGQVLTSQGAGVPPVWSNANAQLWGLKGNAGTTPGTGATLGTNFIGTTDNKALDFVTNNTVKARITARGVLETYNVGKSVFIGEAAGANEDLNNRSNVFVGYSAGNLTTTGGNNVALGSSAFLTNVSGSNNNAMGAQALYSNTTGTSNVANGPSALYANTTGNYNNAIGSFALTANTIGTQNNALGASALNANITGNANTAVGDNAMASNTGGGSNTAVGTSALFMSTGDINTAVGTGSLYSNSTGAYNTALGATALASNLTGTNNIGIGYAANVGSGNLTNAIAIGASSVVNTSNSLVLGGTGANAVNVGIGTSSPAQALDVVGNLQFSKALMPNASAGTTGQVLTSQGTGAAPVWSSLSASGTAGGDLTGTYPNPTIAAGKVTSTSILDGTIVDADISTTAAIQDSKLATITTAGKVSGNAITSGTIAGTTAVNTSGSITTTTGVTASNATTATAVTASNSSTGSAITATSTSGTTVNVTATTGNGVYAVTGNTGGGYGVYGEASGHVVTGTGLFYFYGAGVFGKNTFSSSTGYLGARDGVGGVSVSGNGASGTSTNSNGVYGSNTGTTNPGTGVYGETVSPGGNGVYGNNTGTTTAGVGVYGETVSPGGHGVAGYSTGSSGGVGVYGSAVGTYSTGVSGSVPTSVVGWGVSGSGYYGVQGSGTYGVYGSGTSIGVYGYSASYGVYGSGTTYGVYSSGPAGGTTTWASSSDIRFKKNIQPLYSSLDKVIRMRGVQYDWRADEFPKRNFNKKHDVGVIAQEIKEILPEVVVENEDGFYSVSYEKIVPVLIEAIKEQQVKILALEKDKEELEALKSRLASIEAFIRTQQSATETSVSATGHKK